MAIKSHVHSLKPPSTDHKQIHSSLLRLSPEKTPNRHLNHLQTLCFSQLSLTPLFSFSHRSSTNLHRQPPCAITSTAQRDQQTPAAKTQPHSSIVRILLSVAPRPRSSSPPRPILSSLSSACSTHAHHRTTAVKPPHFPSSRRIPTHSQPTSLHSLFPRLLNWSRGIKIPSYCCFFFIWFK